MAKLADAADFKSGAAKGDCVRPTACGIHMLRLMEGADIYRIARTAAPASRWSRSIMQGKSRHRSAPLQSMS